jgi:dipeptidyl aminopeptidase/acylaminoacyl peptidase
MPRATTPRITSSTALVAAGSRLAAGSSFELLLVDLRRDTVSRPTLGLSVSQAYWYRDGQSLVGVLQEGPATRAIVRIPASEGGTPEPLLRTNDVIPTSPGVSPDGQYLAYARIDNRGGFDIYLRRLSGTGEVLPLVADPSYEASPRISPDGRWFAYHSNEGGELNVFIRSFPDGRVKQQVSVDGGQRPAWRSDGRELYYLAPDGGLWAASVNTTPTLATGAPERLFTAPVDPTFGTPGAQLFDPEPGGQRFVMLVPTADVPQPVTVILNWSALLFPQ